MLTFLGSRQPHCDGINRRNFLALGAFGAGMTLADQLRAATPSNPSGRPRLTKARAASGATRRRETVDGVDTGSIMARLWPGSLESARRSGIVAAPMFFSARPKNRADS